jgi:serine/threonine-protein phosphatase 6 regulatory ankyrin repeat subunit B
MEHLLHNCMTEVGDIIEFDYMAEAGTIHEQIHDFNAFVRTNNFEMPRRGINRMSRLSRGVLYMLKHYDYNIDNVDNTGRTALHVAARSSNKEMVAFLLDRMTNLSTMDENFETALMVAAGRGNIEIFLLIARKLDSPEQNPPIGLHADIHVKQDGENLLMMACKAQYTRYRRSDVAENSSNIVKLLLTENFNPYFRDDRHQTALHYVTKAHIHFLNVSDICETMSALIGAVRENTLVHMKDIDGNTTLHQACAEFIDGEHIIPFLLEHGARTTDINLKMETPLHKAARHGTCDMAEFLLLGGADAKAKDRRGRTPIHAAVVDESPVPLFPQHSEHSWDLVNQLLGDHDILSKLAMKDNQGLTPLLLACKENNWTSVDGLIEISGIDINAVDMNGISVLHECVRRGWHEIVEDLIRLNVDIYVHDNSGETPLKMSERLIHESPNQPRLCDQLRICASLLRKEYETDESSMLAFSMGQQDRLGAGSSVRSLDPEMLRIVHEIHTSRNRTR